MKDNQEFNIKFVNLVENYPCLYDNTREDYHMSNVQEQAWSKIVNDIGDNATVVECKQRWRNLRGSYTKHLKNYVPSGSGTTVKRRYYLSEYMQFIIPFTKSRKPKGNIEFNDNENSVPRDNEPLPHDDDEVNITEIEEEDTPIADVPKKPKLSTDKKYKKNINCQEKYARTLDDVNKTALEYFERKKQAAIKQVSLDDDADKQFLLSLLPDMKIMSDKQKRKFKIGILNLAGNILDEPTTNIFSPTTTLDMDSSRPSTSCSNSLPTETATYEDISFSSFQYINN